MATSIFPSAGSGGTPGGSSGDLQYNNAGAFGGYTPGTGVVTWLQTPSSANLAAAVTDETGSGALVFGTSPTLTTPAVTTSGTVTRDSIGATSTDGWILQNTTAATAGAQQYSPRLRLTGQGWKTTATAGSQVTDWVVENIPTQGTTAPTTNLSFSSQVNGGGYLLAMSLVSGSGTPQLRIYNPSNTAQYAGISWSGIVSAGNYSIDGAGAGVKVSVNKDAAWSWSQNASGGNMAQVDLALWRDAAGVMAQRNSTSAQAYRIYNTYTSSTSYERLDIDWQTTANVCLIGAQKGSGGGTARVLSLVYGGTSTAAVTVPITSGNIVFGGGVQLSNAAVTGLVGGALAATTNASIVLYDSTGQAYRVPCII